MHDDYSKSGGRPKGGLNRDKKKLREAINAELKKLGLIGEADEFDAVVMLAVIAMKGFQPGDDQDLHLAAKAASECAKYTRPQPRSVTVDAEGVNRTGFLGGGFVWLVMPRGLYPSGPRSSAVPPRPAAGCRSARAGGGG